MSLIFGRQNRDLGDTPNQLIPPRPRGIGSVIVSPDSALRHSAVWAALRLRADLISTLPVCVDRQVGPDKVSVPLTPFLEDPAGDGWGAAHWLYATQFDLDRCGNTFGIITKRDGAGKPSVVELVPYQSVVIHGNGSVIQSYTIANKGYEPRDIWHEKQFPLAGVPLGLSPVAYAAWSIGQYLSAQQFANDWFANGAIPAGQLQNTAKKLSPTEAADVKDRFKSAVASRDVFVTGADWKYDMVAVAANESQFIEAMNYGLTDISRFFGIPADLIDAVTTKGTITYANISQRNLQLLVINLGPAIIRREYALSQTVARPRSVRLDTNALLRMDTQTLSTVGIDQVAAHVLAPSEFRRTILGLPAFTPEQLAEFPAAPVAPPVLDPIPIDTKA